MTTPTPPNHQSEFVDNRGGNTLDVALVALVARLEWLEWLATNLVNPTDVAIASGYFNPEGFGRIADALAFTPATDRAIQQLLEFLKSGKIEVRRYEKRFLHGKAFIFESGQGVLAGSSSFPYAESTHRELSLRYGVGVTSFRYQDTTIFNKISELLPSHFVELSYRTR